MHNAPIKKAALDKDQRVRRKDVLRRNTTSTGFVRMRNAGAIVLTQARKQ
jgi:hypothetical protein